jgi:hypothetical protein
MLMRVSMQKLILVAGVSLSVSQLLQDRHRPIHRNVVVPEDHFLYVIEWKLPLGREIVAPPKARLRRSAIFRHGDLDILGVVQERRSLHEVMLLACEFVHLRIVAQTLRHIRFPGRQRRREQKA